jgi:hypothetical protein
MCICSNCFAQLKVLCIGSKQLKQDKLLYTEDVKTIKWLRFEIDVPSLSRAGCKVLKIVATSLLMY